jgi:hypothetical protein
MVSIPAVLSEAAFWQAVAITNRDTNKGEIVITKQNVIISKNQKAI